jgi:Holliday junction resolvase RusA-like endonuclease
MKPSKELLDIIARMEAEGRIIDYTPKKSEVPVPKKKHKRKVKTVGAHWSVTLTLPCRVYSVANAREHWSARHRKFKAQAVVLEQVMKGAWLGDWIPDLPLKITWTHIGRRMDRDNLAGSFKSLQDSLARAFFVDDGYERLCWVYEQRAGKNGGVEVRIEPLSKGDL